MKTTQYLFKVGNSMGIFSDDLDYMSDYRGYKGFSEKFSLSEIENGGWMNEYDDSFDYENIYGIGC